MGRLRPIFRRFQRVEIEEIVFPEVYGIKAEYTRGHPLTFCWKLNLMTEPEGGYTKNGEVDKIMIAGEKISCTDGLFADQGGSVYLKPEEGLPYRVTMTEENGKRVAYIEE